MRGFTFSLRVFNSAISSADLLLVVDATLRVVEEGEVDDLPVEEATDAVLRTVDGVPVVTRVGRVVEAVGEVTFLVAPPPFTELVVERTEGTVVFRVNKGDAVVDPGEVTTEALLVTPGVTVAREVAVAAVLEVVVVVPIVEGVLEARTELAVGFVAVVERAVGEGFVAVLVGGVLEGFAVLVGTAGFLVPALASPAAAKDDMRLLTLGELSLIWYTI